MAGNRCRMTEGSDNELYVGKTMRARQDMGY